MYHFSLVSRQKGAILQLIDGSIQAFNPDAESILELKFERLEEFTDFNSRWRSIEPNESLNPKHLYPAAIVLATGKACENVIMSFTKPSGEVIWLSLDAQPLFQTKETTPYAVVINFWEIATPERVEDGCESAKNELQIANERFELAAKAVNCLIFDWDLRIDRIERSCGLTAILGYSLEEAEPTLQWWFDRMHPEDFKNLDNDAFWDDLNKNGRYHSEYRMRHRDGHYIWVEDRSIAVKDSSGKIIRIVGSITDVSDRYRGEIERKQAEIEIAEREQRYRYIFEAVGVSVWEEDFSELKTAIERLKAEGVNDFRAYCAEHPEFVREAIAMVRILDVNQITLQMFEAEDKQQLLNSLAQIFMPETTAAFIDELIAIANEETFYSGETVSQTLKGNRLNVLFTIRFPPANQRFDRVLVSLVDISDRVKAETALREKTAILDAINQATSTLIFAKDIQGRFTLVNPGTIELIGKPESEIIGKTDLDINLDINIDPDDAMVVMENDRLIMETGETKVFEETVKFPQHTRTYLSTKFPYRDEAGNIIGIIGVSTDITDRKRTSEQLARQAQLLDLTYEAIFVRDIDNSIVYWNRSAEELYGWKEFEAIGQNSHTFLQTQMSVAISKGDRDGQIKIPNSCNDLDRILLHTENWQGELIHTRRDGRQIVVESRQVLVKDEDTNATGILEVNRDITDRKQMEKSLLHSEERLQSFFRANTIGVIYGDVHGNILEANDEFLRIVGYTREELETGRLRWNEITPEEFLPLDREKIAEAKERGACTAYEKEYICKNGNRVPVLVGYGLVGEAREESVAFILDLSDRKQAFAREKVAREEAENANRIKDEFLAVLSHELRSPLNPILGWTQMLQTYSFDEEKKAQGLAAIERNAKSLLNLIDDLLDIARILRGKMNLKVAPVDLVDTIQAALETVSLAANAKSIAIETKLASIGQVMGDFSRLQQIIWNLLSNAIKFTPNGGRIDLRLDRVGNEAQITVSDTGKGIESKFLPHVFEYFRQADSSTTRQFGGLGLGLAIVRHLVELHGGRINVSSLGIDSGATFTVNLPLLDSELESDRNLEVFSQQINLTGTKVLLVEDDPDNLEFLALTLSYYQADVIPCSCPQEALVALENDQPDILISDIAMPEMDGYELLQQIRNLQRDRDRQIPAIALTAYARTEDAEKALSAGFQRHISKPVDLNLLANTILEILQE
jgi:PAS domain S-box-containing protein